MTNTSNTNLRYRPKPVSLDDLQTNEDRSVKPLTPCEPCRLPIAAIRPDRSVLMEQTGQVLSFGEYVERLPYMRRHLVVTFSADAWLWLLNECYEDNPGWTWRVMVQRKPHARKLRTHVTYYGFRRGGKAFANPVIDAGAFTRDRDANLMEIGQWVREFCNAHGLRIRASAAGIAAQLLRHPMFYPDARRMVPKFINDTAREHLPGPFYESYVDAVQEITAAMYVDQQAAYHYAAQQTPLPNANSIHAFGYSQSERVYAREGGELLERELQKHGLIHAYVDVPEIAPEHERFLPRTLRTPGRRTAWIWTSELPYLREFGLRVLHIISTWGSRERDMCLPEYARWAEKVSREQPHLKALLLMPYGALGRRPDTIEIHTPGTEDELLLAGHWIDSDKREANVTTYTANALQLGLIQAHVRTLSLDMARQLSAQGSEIISVYADGIFIRLDDTRQIPMFAPWRLKEDNLEVHLSESLRVPVRSIVRRDYLETNREGIA